MSRMETSSNLRGRNRNRSVWGVLRRSVERWLSSNAPTHSAALAFYTLFSMAPVLLVVIAIAGTIFGHEATQREIVSQIYNLMGPEGAQTVSLVLESASRPELSGAAGLLGVFTLLLGATAVFGQLQEALNEVWGVSPQKGKVLRSFLRKRLLSFGLVVVIGFLLLVSLVLSAAVSALGAYLRQFIQMPPPLFATLNFLVFFLLISVLFALMYRVLPDARIGWRDVAVGAVGTSLLFSLGKYLIGAYLGRTGIASAYGVAGSLVLMLVWIYYSTMLILLGAGFTRVWSRHDRPQEVIPEEGAEVVTGDQEMLASEEPSE